MTKDAKGGNRRRTLTAPALAGLMLGGLLLGACAGGGSPGFDPERTVALPESQLQFANINPAIRMATAWGDKGQGAHGTFGKFPPNFITPMHSHSSAYHGIVLQGVMTNPFEGESDPPKLPAGSYWFVPAGAIHATACVSATPCEFYFHAGQAFDFQMAGQ